MIPGPPDNCPRCVTVTVWPYRIEGDPGGMRAHYACPGCGHRWWTGWLLSPDEMDALARSAA